MKDRASCRTDIDSNMGQIPVQSLERPVPRAGHQEHVTGLALGRERLGPFRLVALGLVGLDQVAGQLPQQVSRRLRPRP